MSHAPRAAHPYLTLVGITVGLVVLLGIVGTICFMVGLSGYAPLAFGYIPIAIVITVLVTKRHAWGSIGFRRARLDRTAVWAIVLACTLPLGVILGAEGISASGAALLMFAGFALLVAFVEEVLFRGVLFNAFIRRGPIVSILVPSIGFALAHTVTALSPEQDALAMLRTVAFAFAFGVIAALLVRLTSSIWLAIALHAVFDFVGFIVVPRSNAISDLISIVLAFGVAAALVVMSTRVAQRRTETLVAVV
ncbi:lysostaphin resistance A-like protein [Leifsonia sp. A12D58]|uniref:CPBP family intramembrane glutamic endopeptidase n=1 Tax=Leifsonia sp. A12D58 TaxID=3397674 RepID=UPI0039E0AD10